MHDGAQRRVDAVDTDQNVAPRRRAILELCRDATGVLGEAGGAAAGAQCRAQAFGGGAPQQAVQTAAVNGDLRHVVTGIGAARLGPDDLAEAVGVAQLARADADLVERL